MRASLSLLIASALIAACSTPATSSHPSPSPSRVTATPTPSAAASDQLACRLPVAGFPPSVPKGAAIQPSRAGRGGFIDLPSGKYTPAADSDVSYLASQGVWLPVEPQYISPDQKSYVQAESPQYSATPTTTLYLVDVKTRAKRLLLTTPQGYGAYIEAFNLDGIYAGIASSTGPGAGHLILIDPTTGASHTVAGSELQTGGFSAISGGAAWGLDIRFPNGQNAPYVAALVRLGLKDGSVSTWYEDPTPFFIVGFDADEHPLLASLNLSGGSNPVILVAAPGKATRLDPVGGQFVGGRGTRVSDNHGAWIGSVDGSIWLYSAAGGLRKVATVPAQEGATGQPYDEHAWRSIAGPCV
jgi:hypothetical protein